MSISVGIFSTVPEDAIVYMRVVQPNVLIEKRLAVWRGHLRRSLGELAQKIPSAHVYRNIGTIVDHGTHPIEEMIANRVLDFGDEVLNK